MSWIGWCVILWFAAAAGFIVFEIWYERRERRDDQKRGKGRR